MFRKLVTRTVRPQIFTVLLLAIFLTGGIFLNISFGDQLPQRSLKLDYGLAAHTDTYQLSFTLPNLETLGSIQLDFCSDSPIIGDPCAPPVGLDISTAGITFEGGAAGFSIATGVTANSMVLTRPPAAAAAGVLSYTFTPVTNPTNPGTYYARIQTFPTADASGPATDAGGIAFAINGNLSLTATVPPFLYFCVAVSIPGNDCVNSTGDYINLGELTTAQANTATTQMLAATNATDGYTVFLGGTTMTSGNNIIPELDTSDVSRPGTGQFGINLVANQDPHLGDNPTGGFGTVDAAYNQPNLYRFVPGEFVAGSTQTTERTLYTTSYIVNIAKTQPAGVYVSTITYIATGAF